MYNVTKWVQSVALARRGFDENQIETLIRMSTPPAWAAETLGEAGVVEMAALNSLAVNWRNMDGGTFQEAMTTAHFAGYFGDAVSRAFFNDYTYKGFDWRVFTYPDTAPDFRDVERFHMSEPGTLYPRREKAELKASHIVPTPYAYGVEEFGRQFDVSWRVILNDDLGKIRETPQRMASAVRRFEDEFVSTLYDNATTQAALVALGALYSGTGRLTAPNLMTAINAMKTRVDADGNALQVTGIWLVIPPILEMTARQLLDSVLLPGSPNNDTNVIPTFIRGYRVDPYIDTAPPNIPWYLFADPTEFPAVPVVRLNGWTQPLVYMKRSNIEVVTGTAPAAFLMGSFETGDIEYAVSTVIGGNSDAVTGGVVDVNGIYYSDGTVA